MITENSALNEEFTQYKHARKTSLPLKGEGLGGGEMQQILIILTVQNFYGDFSTLHNDWRNNPEIRFPSHSICVLA